MIKKRILKVRVDGGRQIGIGHIIRCLSLSKYAYPFFDKVTFFIAQPENAIIDLVSNEGFDTVTLQESEDFFRFLVKGDVVLMDGYHFTEKYELAIKSLRCKIITIDDLQNRRFYADVIINHTPGVNLSNYLTEPNTKIFLGLKYALIRQEFITAVKRERAPETLTRAFLCFGGADPENFTLQNYRFLLSNLPNVSHVQLIVGPSYIHLSTLIGKVQKRSFVEIHQNVKPDKLIEFIRSSDFAIVSASTISIECMKIGIPLYLIKTAENQAGNYNYLLKKGCAEKVENILNYSFSSGEKMLLNQAAEFGNGIEENLKSIFQEALPY